jgi:hypothetical protein
MALPVELREIIYNYLLVTPALIENEPRDLRPPRRQCKSSGRSGLEFDLKGIQDCEDQQRIDPKIMFVSKAIHDEAKPFLYSKKHSSLMACEQGRAGCKLFSSKSSRIGSFFGTSKSAIILTPRTMKCTSCRMTSAISDPWWPIALEWTPSCSHYG